MNPYVLLGVLPNASAREIESAYRLKTREFLRDNDSLTRALDDQFGAAYVHLLKIANTHRLFMTEEEIVMEKYRLEKLAFPQIMNEAMDRIKDKKRVSESYFQKKLGLTLTTARKVIDELERLGAIGPDEGEEKRRVIR
jgi:DNA segregation ATPase FtsK/SpoIIIE-like protein